MTTIREITEQWLRDNGYGGLYYTTADCRCEVDDLMACGEPTVRCQPGYRASCDGDCDAWFATGDECEFHIVRDRP
ncbi:MAG: hypothetical protein GY844_26160 [Bradyrhizobium sp.]|nr:hypothetical protein [Bradyrhizobium sp.]